MANEKHLLLTATGGWVDSDLSTEIWQVGLRLALVFGDVDNIGTLPNNWNPASATISRTETNWNIDGNWIVDGPAVADFDPGDYLNDQCAPAFDDWMDTAGRSTGVRLDALKLYPIGTDGKAIPAPPFASGTPCTLTWTSGNPLGATAGNLMPINNAIVASHRTGQIGRAGRGRMFIPGFAAGANSAEGLVDNTVLGFLLGAQVTLMEALAISSVTLGAPQVRPIVTGGGYTQYATITQVRMGNVWDTQNRRRRQLVETYSSSSVSY
jgi:hypothetical protein